MSANSIDSVTIIDDSINGIDIKSNAITDVHLANNSVTKFEISTGAVESAGILDGTIVAADINNNSIQQRVTGSCSAGSSIRVIANDGTVTCETDDSGVSGWSLTGNSGTSSATNFIGTTDNQALEFKVNNVKALEIKPYNGNESNFIVGYNNSIDSLAKGSNSILGGVANSITAGTTNSVVGGNANFINGGQFSVIIGGQGNSLSNYYSVVAGGKDNHAGGKNSFVAGVNAKVRGEFEAGIPSGDKNTFIWSQTGVTSTAPNQVLFEAIGGFGIGTNAPLAPFHVKGKGATFSTLTDQIVEVIEPKLATDNVAIAINKLDSTKESALVFSTNQAPEFDIRNANGGVLDFSSFDNLGASTFMLRINDKATNRIDINSNLEPQVNDSYNFGSSSFRWDTLYTVNVNSTNAVNVTSDKRLKENIQELKYGLSDILEMRPVSYSMKNGGPKQLHLGLIAQEVEAIVPEIVSQADDELKLRSMRYTEIVPVLIKATQEQQDLMDQQFQQINKLQSIVSQQSDEIQKLQSLVESLIQNNK